jgi:hypothetical protein
VKTIGRVDEHEPKQWRKGTGCRPETSWTRSSEGSSSFVSLSKMCCSPSVSEGPFGGGVACRDAYVLKKAFAVEVCLMGSLSKRNIRVNADGPRRLLDRRSHLSSATSRNGGICFPSPVARLNHARVAFAVESHREGTVVCRFFSTEGVQS